eukprot:TRINITY_DN122917_c0_g1_i1.p1 TRINITY_DN122917_c0_g1~~TRINITY_DN122917_c0_g1_i1.p1  ORF type:complete len:561 (-),score=136.01 TRINITY_DN122917_c0_g1_i1:310-1992(-)
MIVGMTSSLSPTRRRRLPPDALPSVDVDSKRQTRDEAAKGRAVVKNRKKELKDIFTSRHAGPSDVLRAQLGKLEFEAEGLHERIARLERELHEAQLERTRGHDSGPVMGFRSVSHEDNHNRAAEARDQEKASAALAASILQPCDCGNVPKREDIFCSLCGKACKRPHAPGDDVTSEASTKAPSPDSSRLLSLSVDREPKGQSSDHLQDSTISESHAADGLPARRRGEAGGPHGDEVPKQSGQRDLEFVAQLYNQEVLSPLLNKRRAEARYREATLCHESILTHLRNEITVVQRRMHRQQVWMKKVQTEVLKAEIAKAKYQVRLESSEKRNSALGKDLSRAYEEMTRLLKDRLDVEGIAAQSDALQDYISHINQADQQNDVTFVHNSDPLRKLLTICHKGHHARRMYAEEIATVTTMSRLSNEVVEHAETLQALNEQLQRLWIAMPAALKESVFSRTATLAHSNTGDLTRSSTMSPLTRQESLLDGVHKQVVLHPATALTRIQVGSSAISDRLTSVGLQLDEAKDRHDELCGHLADNTTETENEMSYAIDRVLEGDFDLPS